MNLSQIESGKLTLKLEPCAVTSIIDKVISELRQQAEYKSIMLNTEIPNDIPNILADEVRVAQVLLNLIDNAIKYTQESGKVTISAADHNSYVQVSVSDSGDGIPEKDLPRIFERFYRVDKARSRQLGGTGLGLSIVKHIVQAHRGEVFVKSILGQGSTFSFTIPKSPQKI